MRNAPPAPRPSLSLPARLLVLTLLGAGCDSSQAFVSESDPLSSEKPIQESPVEWKGVAQPIPVGTTSFSVAAQPSELRPSIEIPPAIEVPPVLPHLQPASLPGAAPKNLQKSPPPPSPSAPSYDTHDDFQPRAVSKETLIHRAADHFFQEKDLPFGFSSRVTPDRKNDPLVKEEAFLEAKAFVLKRLAPWTPSITSLLLPGDLDDALFQPYAHYSTEEAPNGQVEVVCTLHLPRSVIEDILRRKLQNPSQDRL